MTPLGPSIRLTKLISVDGGATFLHATAPLGPTLTAPTGPVFKYIVANNGTQPLTEIELVDSDLGDIAIPTTSLQPGRSFEVAVTGTFAYGQQENTATVTACAGHVPVCASDHEFWVGVARPSLAIHKLVSVNGGATFVEGASPGPVLTAPTRPQFRITVTNTSPVTIHEITLVDTVLGPITIPTTTLAPGQSFTVTVSGTFAVGEHCNVARVTGTAQGHLVTASAEACFCGVISSVPVFPPLVNPAPQNQIMDRLLETIALEELAFAALINSEAEKLQAVVAAGVAGPVDVEDLEAINASVTAVIGQAAEKERNLRRKLETLLAHKATFPEQCPPVCTNCPPDCCPPPCPPVPPCPEPCPEPCDSE